MRAKSRAAGRALPAAPMAPGLVDIVLVHLAEVKAMRPALRATTAADVADEADEHLARCAQLYQELLREMLTTPIARRLQLPRQDSLDAAARSASVRRQLGLEVARR